MLPEERDLITSPNEVKDPLMEVASFNRSMLAFEFDLLRRSDPAKSTKEILPLVVCPLLLLTASMTTL